MKTSSKRGAFGTMPSRRIRAVWRRVSLLMLVTFALLTAVPVANAADVSSAGFPLPGLGSLFSSERSWSWSGLPKQPSGTAAGHSHSATAADTRSGKGVGNGRGKGKGELAPAANPVAAKVPAGPSAKARTGFDAHTSKEDPAKRTAKSRTFANSDGSTSVEYFTGREYFKGSDGTLQAIDPTLTANADGRLTKKADSQTLSFAPSGDDPSLMTFGQDGYSVSFGLSGGAKVKPAVSGTTATYSGILPNVDMRLAATKTGVKEDLLLNSSAVQSVYTYDFTTSGGLTAKADDGGVSFVDAQGVTQVEVPNGIMTDSKVDARSGQGAQSNNVVFSLVQDNGRPALRMTLDAAWLADPARVFPVTVDPTTDAPFQSDDSAVMDTSTSPMGTYSGDLKSGSFDGVHNAASFVHYSGISNYANEKISAVTLNLWQTYSSYCTAPESIYLYQITGQWNVGSINSYPGVPHNSTGLGSLSTIGGANCNGSQWDYIPLSSAGIAVVQSWAQGAANYGFLVEGNTGTTTDWKRYNSVSEGGVEEPSLTVTYSPDVAPQVDSIYPSGSATASTLTPELLATGHDPDQFPNPTLQYEFVVFNSAGTKIADSGMINGGDWTVPSGVLAWGQSYEWQVVSFDGDLGSAWQDAQFTTVVPQPPITSALSQNTSGHGFDATIGNYTTSATDAQVPGAGPTLSVARNYNSADPRATGAFGAAWSSVFDAKASEQYTNGALTAVNVTYPDGSEVGYGNSGNGTFAPPQGRYAVLKQISGGYTLTDKNDTVYTFSQSLGGGVYGITTVADASGRTMTMTWSNGEIGTMTSGASGRALHLSWTTPSGAAAAHVATVATDPATVGSPATALSWTYNYTGDQLSSVCSPVDIAPNCTTYNYGMGSAFPATVLNTAPHSYWRLDEPVGGTAASGVLVNEGTDNLTYVNTTGGQPGPLTGGSATSTGFTGSNSYLYSQGRNMAAAGSFVSIGAWFKTTTAGGVIFYYGDTPLSDPNVVSDTSVNTPALYVGTDGKLHGCFSTGHCDPSGQLLTSGATVTDGNWHYALLSGAGTGQTLYLDGVAQANYQGSVQIKMWNQPYIGIGAGVASGGWQYLNPATINNFNGAISDVAVWTQPMSGGQVTALYQAGHRATNLITKSTRPSGDIAAQVNYDTVSGRVFSVTDNNGGTWTVPPATVTGSSQVFRSAVMAAAPTGYWRLGDAAGVATATDEVTPDGSATTYANVTLGQPGVFSDATATAFNGSSSYLRLPSYAEPLGNAASVAMWFKTNTPTGMLLDYQFAPVGTTNYNGVIQMDAYVGSDGKLYGGFYTGSNPQMSSGVTVTDGKWHYMVLSGSGTSQNLYLDGKSVASTTTSAPVQPQTQPYVYVGAGSTGTGWTQMPASTNVYFNGSISDVAFYQSGVSAAQVAQQWTSSQNSSGLTPVMTTKVVDPAAVVATMPFDGTTYAAASGGKSWDLAGARLTFQSDGNFVIYKNYQPAQNTGVPIWYSGTYGNPNAILDFQTDGNLVLYSDATKSRALWYTGTYNGSGNTATFEPDGTFTVTHSSTVLWNFTSPVMNAKGVTSSALDPNAGYHPLSSVDAAGVTTTYGYDTSGFLNTTTDGDGNTVTTGHDIRGNEVSRTTCQVQSTNTCSTAYYTFWPDDITAQLIPDPRNDMVTSYRDPRSASASDNTYLTSYTYDASGNLTSTTTPPVPGFPNGRTSTTSYTTLSTAAADSGTTPPGLVAKKTTDAGLATITTYNHNGDVKQTTDPAGLVTSYTFDNLGRMLTKTVTSDSYPAGLTTTYVSDGLNRVHQESDPSVTDRVTGAVHTATTTTTYDVDGNVAKTEVDDTPAGGDASRITSSHFNALDQQDSMTDAAGNVTQYHYDPHGYRDKVTNAKGVETDTAYDADGNVLSNTLMGYTGDPVSPSAATNLITSWEYYDPAGRLAQVNDAMGNLSKYTYTDNGLIASITRYDSTGHNPYVLQSSTYDAAGNLLSRSTHNNSDTTTYQVDAATRVASSTVDPTGVDRTSTYTYSPDDVVTSVNNRDNTGTNSTTTYGLDAVGRQNSKTVHAVANGNGPAVAAGQVGSWALNDAPSGTAADDSGNADTGSLNNGVSWSTDHSGSAVFDGTTGAITMPQTGVDTTKSFTVSTWAKANSNGSLGAVLAQNGSQQSLMAIYADAGSTHNWSFELGSADAGWSFDWVSSGVTVTPGQWVQITGVFNAANSTISIYVNGLLKGTASHTARLASSGMEIGRMKGNGSEGSYFKGEVSGTRTYNRVLTDAEIQNLYSGAPGQQTQNGLTGQWNLNDGNVATAADTSGSNHTGTLSGGSSWSAENGGSAVFDGSTGSIATNGPVVDTSKSYSIAAWAKVNPNPPTGNHEIASQDGTTASSMMYGYSSSCTCWWMYAPSGDVTNAGGPTIVSAANSATPGTWHQVVATFDSSSKTMTLYVDGAAAGTSTDSTAWSNPTGSFVIGRSKYNGSATDFFPGKIQNVQVYNRALSVQEVSSLRGNNSILPADGTTTTSWHMDDRGLITSSTDANNNVTTYVNDEGGHRVITSAPAVAVETGGGSPVQAHPVTTIGYDTFGEAVESQDPDGNVIKTAYDADGNVHSVTQPNYTAPGSSTPITAVTTNTYDPLGKLLTTKDPVGNTTSYSYDQRSLPATVTAPDNSVSHTTYDNNGEQLSITDGNGATTQTYWDYLGRKQTSVQLERYPTAASYTTQYFYDTYGWPQSVTSPTGVVTKTTYDHVGELSSSVDGANNTTTYHYDFLGDQYLTTLPDGSNTETDYNALQQPYQTITHDPLGAVLSKTTSILDGNGNPLSTKDANGNTTTFQYDPSGVVSSETQPRDSLTSITTSFGYDAAGNRTRYTDGNGNKWISTYNTWNLPESYIEPATSQYTAASDSTFTTAYDADGRPVSQAQPGGVVLSTSYNSMGGVSSQSGTGAEAATAARSFTYDHLGRTLTAATAGVSGQAATSDTFTYNDRGDLLTAAGSAGSSNFSYYGDNTMASRADASGATNYGYDTAGRLQTINDGASGNTLTYYYNNLDQVQQIKYGVQNVRTFGYDTSHRLHTDTLTTSSGTAIASITYGYDPNNNLTSKTTSGFTGASSNTYQYDDANRLTSWNNGTTTVQYGYDNRGNRTQVGTAIYTYDARDELTSDGTGTYSYSARGTQTAKVGTGASTAAFDAYGQAITASGQNYTYDAAGRLVNDATAGAGTRTLSYSGAADLVAGDGSNVYSYDPAGNLTGIGVAGQSTGSGLQAMVDSHTDVVGAFTATGTTLTGSTAYDPLGNKIGTSSTPGSLGYQSQWVEAANGQVKMGSRWYNPATGQFTSRDTKLNSPVPNSANANPFAYAADNPLTLTDPTGHDALDDEASRHAGIKAAQQANQDWQQLTHDAEQDDFDGCGTHGACITKHAHLWQTNTHYVKDRVNNYIIGERNHWASLHDYVESIDLEECGTHGRCMGHRANLWQHNSGYVAQKTSDFLEDAARKNAEAEASWGAKAKAESTPPPTAKAKHSGGFLGALKGAANFVYHASGLSDIVDCVSHPNIASCAQAVLTVVTTVGTGGESMAGEALIEGLGKDLLETGVEDVAKTGAKDVAETAEKDVAHEAEGELSHESVGENEDGASCGVGDGARPHSFIGTTPVLMANGTSKPISQIKVGDTITNSQPGKTGETEAHKVDAIIVTYTDHDYTDVTVTTPHGDKTITTTVHHPFYDVSQSAFVMAGDLKAGDKLQTPDGTASVRAVRNYHGAQITYDLTIDGLHTYYVEAGDTPVLVHNCGTGTSGARFEVDSNGVATDTVHGDPNILDRNPLDGTRYTPKVLRQAATGDYHGFPEIADTLPTMRDATVEPGGDGIPRMHVRLPGEYDGKQGVFHWIIEQGGSINHRLFEPFGR